jgi:hypothetical protein
VDGKIGGDHFRGCRYSTAPIFEMGEVRKIGGAFVWREAFLK